MLRVRRVAAAISYSDSSMPKTRAQRQRMPRAPRRAIKQSRRVVGERRVQRTRFLEGRQRRRCSPAASVPRLGPPAGWRRRPLAALRRSAGLSRVCWSRILLLLLGRDQLIGRVQRSGRHRHDLESGRCSSASRSRRQLELTKPQPAEPEPRTKPPPSRSRWSRSRGRGRSRSRSRSRTPHAARPARPHEPSRYAALPSSCFLLV
eukprot:COSAG04_NODE_114_length_25503_cov_39.366832_11_plen_205_part_00